MRPSVLAKLISRETFYPAKTRKYNLLWFLVHCFYWLLSNKAHSFVYFQTSKQQYKSTQVMESQETVRTVN